MTSIDSLKVRNTLTVNNIDYDFYSLVEAEKNGLNGLSNLPFSLKILLENLLRHEDSNTVTLDDIKAVTGWLKNKSSTREVSYRPARVLMQDFTGVPAVVDLAAMRDAITQMGGNPEAINPLSPVDLVIDHSVQVDYFGTPEAVKKNSSIEMARNAERYEFLRWGQFSFENFSVVPPDTGICHQVNLEYLAKTVWSKTINGKNLAYPDTLVGTDSHTTMINGLGVLGWGVGGIEAEAAMLGQPISMLIPEVVGVKLEGNLPEGVTATDLVLDVTHRLREKGVVGKFVEFFGAGLKNLTLADRATLANMAPEYGATCGFFPIDEATIDYLKLTGREQQTIDLVEAYAKSQGLWYDLENSDPVFSDTLQVNLSKIEPSIAGPKRPQDNIKLSEVQNTVDNFLKDLKIDNTKKYDSLNHGDVVIAAITSCTNTSNPSVLMAAGLVAKKALEKGLNAQPWVKTSLAPGSKVVTNYLEQSGLQQSLNELGFNTVGYGCTTCIGNSGPLPEKVANEVNDKNLVVASVLSGNRNFEGRVHAQVKANFLASPPLVVAYAIAGTTKIDITKDALGKDNDGNEVFLKDIWPSNKEVAAEVSTITNKMFSEQYKDVFKGTKEWQAIKIAESKTYAWSDESTYIQHPPFFKGMEKQPKDVAEISGARILALLGDSITTDHISPAGAIKPDSPAGKYLLSKGVEVKDFNSLGARRGNHEVMMRGTFANIRIRNEMLDNIEGGFTKYIPSGETLSIFDAAMKYQQDNTPIVVIAGKEYGTGSSRDWAAKGPKLLGINAVIAESYERIHRSNLIGMGILPLEFTDSITRKTLNLTGEEIIDIKGLNNSLEPRSKLKAIVQYPDSTSKEIELLCRIDTQNEAEYYKNGGILQYVIRKLA